MRISWIFVVLRPSLTGNFIALSYFRSYLYITINYPFSWYVFGFHQFSFENFHVKFWENEINNKNLTNHSRNHHNYVVKIDQVQQSKQKCSRNLQISIFDYRIVQGNLACQLKSFCVFTIKLPLWDGQNGVSVGRFSPNGFDIKYLPWKNKFSGGFLPT